MSKLKSIEFKYSGPDGLKTEYDLELESREWNLEDSADSLRLYQLRSMIEIANLPDHGKNSKHAEYLLKSIDNISDLKNIKSKFSMDRFNELWPGMESYYDGDILVRDRKKKRTLIVISHNGHWARTLASIENNSDQLYIHPQFNVLSTLGNEGNKPGNPEHDVFLEYNYVGVCEDIRRSYDNPILMPSVMYGGINSEIDSIDKLVNWIKNRFADSEYYILSDCKTGHSATMLAEKIYARKIFLISPVTTVDSDYLYNNNTRGLAGMEFVMWTRSLKYSNIFEDHHISINSIARKNPNIQIQIYYHVNDRFMKNHIDYLEHDIDNLNIKFQEPTLMTKDNHFIITELFRSKIIHEFFKP